jgi:hypothetical protein
VVESGIQHRESSCVLLFDPKDLSEIDLNLLRRDTPFDEIQYAKGETPSILLSSEEQMTKAMIQYTRLEFVQVLSTPFAERSLETLARLMRALPELSVKSIGLNYTVAWSRGSSESAGHFIRNHFLSSQVTLEAQLGGEVFAGSARMFFGGPGEYRDIRVTPESLSSTTLIIRYHYHGEEAVKDKDRLMRLLTEHYASEVPRLSNLLGALLKL